MRDDDYEFLSALTRWFNNSYYGVRYGKFSFIAEVKVVSAGCAEGTCRWENIELEGYEEGSGRDKWVRLESMSVIDFFRSIS